MIKALIVALAFVVPGVVLANQSEYEDPLQLATESKVRIGFYSTDLDTNLSLNASNGDIGTDIDFESDLGFPSSTSQFWTDVNWKLNERNYIDANYVSIKRNSTHTIDRDIDFGDQIFEINTTVDAFFDTDYLALSYRNTFSSGAKSEFGASLGVGVLWVSTGIEAVGGPSLGANQDASVTAPFPVLGVHGLYQLAPKLFLTGAAEYFTANISDIDFTVTDFQVGLDYYLSRQFGLGVRYDYNLFESDIDRSGFNGSLDYKFDGLQAYATYNF